jgi:hypothetical protein
MHPGSQPLPPVEPFLITLLRMVLPDPPDVAAKRFDTAKLKEVKEGFKPADVPDGGGCMLTTYNVLDTLYGKGFGERLMKETISKAYEKADAEIKANPARRPEREQLASKHNTSDLTFALMREKGLAGEKVQTANKDADQVIRQLTPKEPGVYFYGLAIKGHHTATLIVEKAADGTHKMHFLDQYTKYDSKQDRFETLRTGESREIKDGKLGDALSNWVFNGPDTTNIYALRPPANAKP